MPVARPEVRCQVSGSALSRDRKCVVERLASVSVAVSRSIFVARSQGQKFGLDVDLYAKISVSAGLEAQILV